VVEDTTVRLALGGSRTRAAPAIVIFDGSLAWTPIPMRIGTPVLATRVVVYTPTAALLQIDDSSSQGVLPGPAATLVHVVKHIEAGLRKTGERGRYFRS